MGFIELNGLGEAQEASNVSSGTHRLVVTDMFQYTKEDTGNDVIRLTLEAIDESDRLPLRHWLSLPGPNDDQQKVTMKMLMLKRFCVAAGIPFEDNGFNSDDLLNAEFDCAVSHSEPNDNGTVYANLDLPRLSG